MNIAIDGRTIAQRKTGVGMYAERLVQALLQCDPRNQYHLFLIEPNDHIAAPNLTKHMIVGYERALLNRYWENFILPKEIRRHKIDIFFDPAYALPFFIRFGRALSGIPLPASFRYFFNAHRKVKYVVTIHDVISRVYPEHFTPKMKMWQRFFLWNAQRSADRVIADSQSTRNDILRFYPSYKDRISVIYPDLSDSFHIVSDRTALASVRSRYSLPEKFILYVGTIEPRKNIQAVAAAYRDLPPEIQSRYELVIGGNIGWYAEKILDEIKSYNLENRVHLIGYVDDAHIPALFSMASVFVFPSLYEGFGYPPLEAMACGVPVVSSDRSSLPEAVGDAAVLVDPTNIQQISDAMRKIISDEKLAEDLRRKGLARSALFTRNSCAEEVLKIFNELVHEEENAFPAA
ncbi:MAG TPA: glycosyltransferase family 1 protein [Bacteroidota bacterium]|nr:glycosyltransferase family 1 protein [Bacteroidota bacterium]